MVVWSLFKQNMKVNQNISIRDNMLAPAHKPKIPPIFDIKPILIEIDIIVIVNLDLYPCLYYHVIDFSCHICLQYGSLR